MLQTERHFDGFKQVAHDQFYGVIYKENLDVHPTPTGKYDPETGYLTTWKMRNQSVWGYSDGIGPDNKRYWLRD